MTYYAFLAGAIASEIIGTTFLKYSDGYSRLVPTICSLLFYLSCHVLFSKAVTHIHLGIGYAVWCGVGIVATTLVSVLIFREAVSLPAIIGIVLILIGCVVLNLG